MNTAWRRTLCGSAMVLALLWAPAGCKRKKAAQTDGGPAPRFASTVHMGDPNSAGQLLSGFHSIEGDAWRWTQKQFVVNLGVPAGAAQQGATLELQLTVPEPIAAQLKSITLTASVNGNVLAPETYSAAGNYTYSRPVPAALLTGEAVPVTFRLDKALPPSPADLRELGIVVLSAGLVRK